MPEASDVRNRGRVLRDVNEGEVNARLGELAEGGGALHTAGLALHGDGVGHGVLPVSGCGSVEWIPGGTELRCRDSAEALLRVIHRLVSRARTAPLLFIPVPYC